MKSHLFPSPFLFILCMFFFAISTTAQELCATDEMHERLLMNDATYAELYEQAHQAIKIKQQSKALDLNNNTEITIPVVVHIMHTGGAPGTIYNPTNTQIMGMIDGVNDFYSNANGNSVDFNVRFELAQRTPECTATNGIIRYDASGVAGYTAGGVDAGSETGVDEVALKALSKWPNTDYYNIWVVNRIDGKDGTVGSFTTGYAYFPGASATRDGTVILATRMVNPTHSTLAHELGHAMALHHVFNGDEDNTVCPPNTDCTSEGDFVCDTDPQKRNASTCPDNADINGCTGTAWNNKQRNFMDYSWCRDRFTSGQRDRFRAAIQASRPSLVSSRGHEAPLGAVAAACIPGINNGGNSNSMGPRQVDFGDSRTTPGPYGWYGNAEYRDMSCIQQYTVYPGQEVPLAVVTGTNRQRVRVYIDYNNNGTLDDAGELAFSSPGTIQGDETHSGTITIPANAPTNTPLRMRVWADWAFSGGYDGPCGNLGYGQAVDYSIVVDPNTSWTGTASSDWADANNWSTGVVPVAASNVTISGGPSNQPQITSAPGTPAQCNNLTIENGAQLSVEPGKALTVVGDVTNQGRFFVKADVTGIGSLITEGTVTGGGIFKTQFYMTGSGAPGAPNGVFHYIGSSVIGAAASDLLNLSFNKLWSYSEAGNGYTQVTTATGPTTMLSPLEGFATRVRADNVRNLQGTGFNTGTLSTSLSRTGTSNEKRGYHLVSNPYPSTVNWDNATRTNLETTIWYRTSQAGTMVFDTYNASTGLGTTNNGIAVTGNIPPGQAVWARVNADGNTGTLAFSNANRSHGLLASIFKTEAEEGTVRMVLSNGTNSDEAIVMFNADAEDTYDDFDSQKFWAAASVPQLYTTVAADSLVINGLNSTATNPVVDLGVKLPTSGDYSLNANSITVVEETIHLEDRLLGIFQNLNVEPNYSFSSSVSGNIPTRFALHFGMTAVGVEDATAMNSRVYISNENQLNVILPESIQSGRVEVLDMAGRMVQAFNLNATRTSVDMNVITGVYLIRVETENGINTYKIILN